MADASTSTPKEQAKNDVRDFEKSDSLNSMEDNFDDGLLEEGGLDDSDSGINPDSPFPANGNRRNSKTTKEYLEELLKKQQGTRRILMFRFMLAGMVVLTTVFSGLAYYFLERKETENFETAVSAVSTESFRSSRGYDRR